MVSLGPFFWLVAVLCAHILRSHGRQHPNSFCVVSVSRATSFVGCRGRLKLCLKTPCVVFLHLALYSLVHIKYSPFLVH
jgi:hypothetical protein